jgi:hypothetical protein
MKSSGCGLENREYVRRDPSRRPRGTLYQENLALTSPTSGGRSVGIVRSRAQTMEFSLVCLALGHTCPCFHCPPQADPGSLYASGFTADINS